MTNPVGEAPPLDVQQAGRAQGSPGAWSVAFDVTNQGSEPVSLLGAWLPHGRFRCPERSLGGTPPLSAGQHTRLSFPVAFDEPPGTVVENAFVILRAEWGVQTWRVLARFTVTAGGAGEPQAVTEVVSAHRLGFSA